jgi:hypothetical protein
MILFNLLVVSMQAFPLSSRPNTEPWMLYVALQSGGILMVSFDPSKPSSTSLQIINVNTDGGFMPDRRLTMIGYTRCQGLITRTIDS